MSSYGICLLSSIPIRTKPANRSEMGSQLLFGETYEVMDEQEEWTKIQCTWDKYTGWINNSQLTEIEEEKLHLITEKPAYSFEIAQPANGRDHYLPILIGSTLPQFDGMNFRVKGKRYTFSGQAIQPNQLEPDVRLAIRIARKYLYAPFMWGGRSPFGIDSTGFVQMIFKMMGVKLPRTAGMQARRGKLVHFINEAQAGDLAFFENERGKIIHVGLILPENEIIHASGQVRIDRLDHYGIFNNKTNRYTYKLRVIKRLL